LTLLPYIFCRRFITAGLIAENLPATENVCGRRQINQRRGKVTQGGLKLTRRRCGMDRKPGKTQ